MTIIAQNLERYWGSIKDQSGEYEFFTGLADYVGYVIGMPDLMAIVKTALDKKDLEYEKLAQLEDQAFRELRSAEKALLRIVKYKKISRAALSHITTISAGLGEEGSVLDSLEKFEKYQIHAAEFRSDTLEKYLWDIAVGIYRQNHGDALKQFIVAGKPSNNTYSPVLFSFSATLRTRREQAERILRARKLEIWGALDHLLKFRSAFTEGVEGTSLMEVFEKHGGGARNHIARNYMERRDVVDVAFGAEDIRKILNMKYGRVLDKQLVYLKMSDFKTYASRAHSYIAGEISKNAQPVLGTLAGKSIEYDSVKSAITIDGTPIPLPPATNEDYLAKAMFSRTVGEYVDWSIVYEDMLGTKEADGKTKQKATRDTVNRLNKRIQEVAKTSDKLLGWKNKSICRNF